MKINTGQRRPPEEDPLTALRLRLLANGYTPLPNFDKVCREWKWPRLVVNAAVIVSWKGSRSLRRQATGLRVENGLCVLDADSTDPRLLDGLRADLAALNPAVAREALERHGGAGGKFALFCQRPEADAFHRIQGLKWVRAEDIDKATEERPEHRLEVFAGDTGKRQFGSFGPHSHDDAGRVLREYRWIGRSPADVPLRELPVITKAEVFKLCDAFDARAKALGYVPVPSTTRGETVPRFVFDLTDDMDFDGTSLDELAIVHLGGRFSDRITSAFLGAGTNETKCHVGWSNTHNCPTVHDYETGITHLPVKADPANYQTSMDALSKLLPKPKDGAPPPQIPETPQSKPLFPVWMYAMLAFPNHRRTTFGPYTITGTGETYGPYQGREALLDDFLARCKQGGFTEELVLEFCLHDGFKASKGAIHTHCREQADPRGYLEGRLKQAKPAAPKLMQTSAEFVADYVPPDYLIDGLMQRRYVYSFTAKTGDGKTSIALLIAAHVARGVALAGREVEKGRVLFFAGENPDDVRTRWIKLCEELGVDPDTVDAVFMPFTLDLTEQKIREKIDAEAAVHGPFSLLIVDTSAAYYSGDDENDNVKLGAHARMLRSFVDLPGGPAILVTCHPTKTPDMNNLLPRGGGAFLAEVDGNLVCIKDPATMAVEVTTHGKFRGPDFAPFSFKLVAARSEKLVDSKGRKIWTIFAREISRDEQEQMEQAGLSDQDRVLRAVLEQPLSLSALAEHLGWLTMEGHPNKQRVHRIMEKLRKAKLVEQLRSGRYTLTKKGTGEAAATPKEMAEVLKEAMNQRGG